MSLTSHLNNKFSPIRQFFDRRFPNTRPVVKEANARLRDLYTIPIVGDGHAGTLAMALDYRLRYYLGFTPIEHHAAHYGAMWISAKNEEIEPGTGNSSPLYPSIARTTVEQFFRCLDHTLKRIQPVGNTLKAEDEILLIRYCFVLALFERCSRARPSPNSLLFSIGEEPSLNQLLDLPDSDALCDIYTVAFRFINRLKDCSFTKIELNPTFFGSRSVGGADADIILDGQLIDFKSTVKARIRNLDLYQIIGYALLDYQDKYKINSLGLYMARQGELLTWTIHGLLDDLMDRRPQPLKILREEFHVMAMENLINEIHQTSDFDHVEGLEDMTEDEFEAFMVSYLGNWPQ